MDRFALKDTGLAAVVWGLNCKGELEQRNLVGFQYRCPGERYPGYDYNNGCGEK